MIMMLVYVRMCRQLTLSFLYYALVTGSFMHVTHDMLSADNARNRKE